MSEMIMFLGAMIVEPACEAQHRTVSHKLNPLPIVLNL